MQKLYIFNRYNDVDVFSCKKILQAFKFKARN